MFKLTTNPTFIHPVKVKMPVDGGYSDQDFRARFRVLPTEATKDFDTRTADGAAGLLRAVVAEVFDLVDDAGAAIAYNDGLREQLIAHPILRQAMAGAYFNALAGAPLGN